MSIPFEESMVPTLERFISLCEPEIRGNEWKYTKECLDTAWVSSVGSFVDRFEKEVATYVGTRHAVATVNGTAALHIALLVAGIKQNEEVLVSTLTFIAPVNAIRYAGAWPVFIDSESDYWQMDPQMLVEFLESKCHWVNGRLQNKNTGRKVRAIMPVHILGHPCDMGPILEAARKYDLVVIEDATESLGAQYRTHFVGQLGDIACFSFNGNKIITTGGGGMIVTDNKTWARKAKYLTNQAKDDPVEYIHNEVGYNYRLTNIQAAVGCAQMEMLDQFVEIKRLIAARYREAFRELSGITFMKEAPWAYSTFWMSTILVDESECGIDSRTLIRELQKRNVQTRSLWQPIHKSPIYEGLSGSVCPVAESLNSQAISLPSSVGLSRVDQERVISSMEDLVSRRG
jgi:perosamine synthetase